VDRHQVAPRRRGHGGGGRAVLRARGVHDAVQRAAGRRPGARDQLVRVLNVGHVGGQRDDAAGRAERGGFFQLRLGARDGHHAAAGRRDRQRHGAAEASPGAGHDVGPPGQAELARGLVHHLCTVPSAQIIESQV
jgi:hypothetical protein